jgi:hypothetical protein
VVLALSQLDTDPTKQCGRCHQTVCGVVRSDIDTRTYAVNAQGVGKTQGCVEFANNFD